MEQQDKPFWQSKSVLAGVIALAAGIAGLFGYAVPEAVQAEIVASVSAIIAGVGGLAYALGQVKRDK